MTRLDRKVPSGPWDPVGDPKQQSVQDGDWRQLDSKSTRACQLLSPPKKVQKGCTRKAGRLVGFHNIDPRPNNPLRHSEQQIPKAQTLTFNSYLLQLSLYMYSG